MHGVILQHVGHVIYWKQVVDTNNYYVILVSLFERSTENKATNTAKSVNTDFNFTHNYKNN